MGTTHEEREALHQEGGWAIYSELWTSLVEVESTLNNQCIKYVYDDESHVLYLLTPATLIYGRRILQEVNESQAEVISTNQSLAQPFSIAQTD